MHTLSIVLTIVAGLAVTGLLYETAAERRRSHSQEISQQEWQRLNTRPLARTRSGK